MNACISYLPSREYVEYKLISARMYSKYLPYLEKAFENGRWLIVEPHPLHAHAYTYDIIYKGLDGDWDFKLSGIYSSAHLFPKYDTVEEAWERGIEHLKAYEQPQEEEDPIEEVIDLDIKL